MNTINDEPSTVVYLYKRFCPIIFDIIKDKVNWIEEDKKFETELQKREAKRVELKVEGFKVRASFIDVLIDCYKGNKSQIDFIAHLNDMVNDILQKIPNIHHKSLREMIKGKITNLKDWNYLNVCGELAILSALLKRGYKLIKIEADYPNRRNKDFLLEDPKGDLSFLEVINIHADSEKLDTEEDLMTFIFKRLTDKINYETEGVAKSENKIPLYFTPVFWFFDMNKLLKLYPFFVKFEAEYNQNCFEYPVSGLNSYIKLTDGENINLFPFGSITSLLKKSYEELQFKN